MGYSVLLLAEAARAAPLLPMLRAAGHVPLHRAAADTDLCAEVAAIDPDIVVIDLKHPHADLLEQIAELGRVRPRPVLVCTDDDGIELVRAAAAAGASAYIVDGFTARQLNPVIELAVARFRETANLRMQLTQARTELEERKWIERAKGILMQQRRMSEEQAYRTLRKLAMDQNKRLTDLARSVVALAEVFGQTP